MKNETELNKQENIEILRHLTDIRKSIRNEEENFILWAKMDILVRRIGNKYKENWFLVVK